MAYTNFKDVPYGLSFYTRYYKKRLKIEIKNLEVKNSLSFRRKTPFREDHHKKDKKKKK